MQFDKHVVVVTGAAKGIGEACARAFHRAGAAVALVDVDKSANVLASSLRERAKYFACDVARSGEVANTFDAIRKSLGETSVLVNNAGIQTYGTCTETSEEDWDR